MKEIQYLKCLLLFCAYYIILQSLIFVLENILILKYCHMHSNLNLNTALKKLIETII